jgi:hypothetical protein
VYNLECTLASTAGRLNMSWSYWDLSANMTQESCPSLTRLTRPSPFGSPARYSTTAP